MSTPNEFDITEKLQTMVNRFRTAMLITRPGDGAPRPRPMTIAAHDELELWFVASRDADLVEELEHDTGCAVAMQGDGRYVALRGLAELRDDIDRVRELWSETMRPWFPHGPTSPKITLVRFTPLEGEYWDVSGIQMVKLLFRAARAYAKGKSLEHESPDQHAGVTL